MQESSKSFGRTPANPLGGTVGSNQLRMLLFQLPKVFKQRVVLLIGNLRVRIEIVEFVVMTNFIAQGVELFFDRLPGHSKLKVDFSLCSLSKVTG